MADVPTMPAYEWDAYLIAYGEGYRHGIARGRELERDEVSALQAEAVRIVHALAELDERDRDADERAAEGRRSWWARKRGEV